MDSLALEQARGWVAEARQIFVLTGAGISAESGVPTFRDALTGLWERFDPEELATEEAYRRQPALVWQWYQHRRELVAAARPNPAHHALAVLARLKSMTLVTQNIDGLHQKAGSEQVVELHGNLFANKWLDGCGRCDTVPPIPGDPPRCAICGAMMRPGVVWFGEDLPRVARFRADHAAESCDLCLVVGTSGLVYPAAALPGVAKENGARVIVVNPKPSALDETADIVLPAPAGECLPLLWPQAV
ncbi:NAD-dependent protein deacetylase/lipoamidase [Cupriavidus metallidurans]|jgi:NAD-dependent deacetylase|uniref:NAD-dependent protein deacylase n=1 Tax=Cupriavidus metallidurans (strain ATCC 43123 / DSM 2839 / NBRC 102507 / CH34) TaxID=266264 RepID=Q1LLK7_CUPMC|nr:NAD-dependent deacylase [Cupriavidus metallidurans]ABF08969.1 NAD-dependent protein deacetylase, SIR2 family [Cupriavidus metallidurans CH34]AVA36182.1 NAD-dependent deacylase [Cupriavidus metallidurans]KWW37739.1 NAD-dependent protein deacylase Sir2 [Cupriavidus metallidurans]MDE4918463.1 NAD-dependent deacylase [Cupriavidus metallidurans]QGS30134.1 NAD-dependent protein deacylase [Cupriavidus metallidurans]